MFIRGLVHNKLSKSTYCITTDGHLELNRQNMLLYALQGSLSFLVEESQRKTHKYELHKLDRLKYLASAFRIRKAVVLRKIPCSISSEENIAYNP